VTKREKREGLTLGRRAMGAKGSHGAVGRGEREGGGRKRKGMGWISPPKFRLRVRWGEGKKKDKGVFSVGRRARLGGPSERRKTKGVGLKRWSTEDSFGRWPQRRGTRPLDQHGPREKEGRGAGGWARGTRPESR
jgi:hypothetical protein